MVSVERTEEGLSLGIDTYLKQKTKVDIENVEMHVNHSSLLFFLCYNTGAHRSIRDDDRVEQLTFFHCQDVYFIFAVNCY